MKKIIMSLAFLMMSLVYAGSVKAETFTAKVSRLAIENGTNYGGVRFLFFGFLLGTLLPLSAYAWDIEGHVSGINGSNMPAYFTFQADADSGDGNCYAQETIKYDGSYSGTTALSNNKVIYVQVLRPCLTEKW